MSSTKSKSYTASFTNSPVAVVIISTNPLFEVGGHHYLTSPTSRGMLFVFYSGGPLSFHCNKGLKPSSYFIVAAHS